MTSGPDWGAGGDPPAAGVVATIFRGSSFCLSEPSGDIRPDRPQGFFYQDTRLLSRWELRVDDREPELLRHLVSSPSQDRFLLRLPPDPGGSDTQC